MFMAGAAALRFYFDIEIMFYQIIYSKIYEQNVFFL